MSQNVFQLTTSLAALISAVALLLGAWAQLRKAYNEKPVPNTQSSQATATSQQVSDRIRLWRKALWKAAWPHLVIAFLSMGMLAWLGFGFTSVTPPLVVETALFSGQFFFSLWMMFSSAERVTDEWKSRGL